MPSDDEIIQARLQLTVTNQQQTEQQFEALLNNLMAKGKSLGEALSAVLSDKNLMKNTTFRQMANDLAKITGVANQAANGVGKIGDKAEKSGKQVRDAFGNSGSGGGKGLGTFSAELSSLGGIAKFVFGTVLGITAVQVLREIIQFFQQAATMALEFNRSLFSLQVGVRALQRAGIDTSMQQVADMVQSLRSEYPIFSTVDIVQGADLAISRLREAQFTMEQMQQVLEVSATLALKSGKSFSEVVQSVVQGLSSGYGETLQRMGVMFDRVSLSQEAMRMGFNQTYIALPAAARAQAGLNLLLRQTAAYSEDATLYQGTLAGRMDAVNNTIKDQSTIIGEELLPVWLSIKEMWASIITNFAGLVTRISDLSSGWNDMWDAIWSSMSVPDDTMTRLEALRDLLFGSLWGEKGRDLQTIFAADAVATRASQRAGGSRLAGAITEGLSDVEVGDELALTLVQEEATIGGIVSDMRQTVVDEMTEMNQDRRDLEEDFANDLEKIERDLAREIEDINRDYQRSLSDMARDAQRDRDKATRDLSFDLESIEIDFINKRQDMVDTANQKLLEAEAKFQEDMRQLREDFLFDLEDVIREGDVRRAIQLVKKYKLEKEQKTRDFALSQSQDQQDFASELADLERQKAEKLRIRREEFAQKMEDLARQAAYERADAAIKHQQDLEDAQRNYEEKREQRTIQYQQQLIDLQQNVEDRLQVLAEGLAAEYELNERMARRIYERLQDYYGPGGYIESLYRYLLNSIQAQSAQVTAAVTESVTSAPTMGSVSSSWLTSPATQAAFHSITVPGYANGGSFLATRPTIAAFGEGGSPEIVTATPVSSLSDGQVLMNGSGRGNDGKVSIEVTLSPDLEGRVLENALGKFSDVLMSAERRRR